MLRRLLLTTFVVGVSFTLATLLWLVAGNSSSAQVEKKNCPADFHWERMSGQCCVQDEDTIPRFGHIGYTGNSLCDDGYAGVYVHRPTTDGKGPPGCPNYTSFAFLTECTKKNGGADAAVPGGSTLGGGGVIRDASEAVYEGGGGPSNRDLATAGAITGTMGAAAGAAALARGRLSGPGAANARIKQLTERLAALDRQYSDAAQALDKAHQDREALEQERKVLEALAGAFQSQQTRLDGIMARIEAYRGSLNTSRAMFSISAALAGLAGLLAAPAIIPQIGVLAGLGLEAKAMEVTALSIRSAALRLCAALAAAVAGGLRSIQSDVWKNIGDGFSDAKARTAQLQSQIRGELNRIPAEYEEATRRQDEALARVNEIRSQQVQVNEELQRAREGA